MRGQENGPAVLQTQEYQGGDAHEHEQGTPKGLKQWTIRSLKSSHIHH